MRWLLGVLAVALGLLAAAVCVPALSKVQHASPAVTPPEQSAPAPPAAGAGTRPAGVLPAGYAGVEACTGCHEEAFDTFARTRMGRQFLKQPRNARERLVCETCHGPGQAHVAAGGGKRRGTLISFARDDTTPIETRNQVCLDCHSQGERLFWKGSSHEARDVACTTCHTVMADVSPHAQLAKATEIETCQTCHVQQARARQWRSSHMPLREGKMSCTSCHNPHGTVHQTLLRAGSLNETCYRCHADKRGPFLWEHAPVGESCTNCHEPHGTNHEHMLKVAKPRLCQQCHIESRHPTNPYGVNTGSFKFVLGASCTSCHVKIHGSNHPSGFAFTR